MTSKADQIELSLSLPSDADASAPVECLGLTFANDAERRAYFLDKLREKLQEPEFRQIEGFPIGADEDILALSDPPYYTACPNPFLADFLRCYGKPYDPETDDYHREPFATDVSEGRSDPIFTAHSYHTKVPHKAIMRYILHYTEPGDVVLDGFAGSGMTGVAAQMCAHPDPDLKYAIESERQNAGLSLPEWGARKTVLNDLGVAATFIEANYNLPFDIWAFEREAKKILSELEEECGWMYETIHGTKTKGRINYTVWSQVFSCPECTGEINFVKEALDPETKRVKESFLCPHCGANLNKGNLERVMETSLDSDTKETWQHIRFDPAIVNYSIGKQKHEKLVDPYDLEILQRIANIPLPEFVPTDAFPIKQMYHGSRLEPKGFTNTHHLFLPRAAQSLGRLWSKVKAIPDDRLRNMLLFFVEQAVWGMSVLARYTPTHFSQVNQYLNGVYYVASQHAECSPWYILDGKLKRLIGAFNKSPIISNQAIVSTGTAAKLSCPDRSVDYIFTDPPFGENIYYADLNFLVESWHKVKTDATTEAIVDKAKNKDIAAYQNLMYQCFAEYYRVLKPNRWMTVVFHNSHNAIWNSMQEAMLKANFVIANVRTLDKQQGSYRQVTSTAVKQDLVITVYKPSEEIEQRFKLTEGTEDGVWDFVRTHLQHLPVFVGKLGQVEVLAERMNYLLFDRMVAFHIQRGATIPLSAVEFYEGLAQRFNKRDEMYFLEEQLAEYDRKRMSVKDILQLELLVTDESTAVQWLRQQLTKRPQTYQELHPHFMKDLAWIKYEKAIELKQILDDNFICYKGEPIIPHQVVSWLRQSAKYREQIQHILPEIENGTAIETTDSLLVEAARDRYYIPDPSQQIDMEKLREKGLLHEFEKYRDPKQQKIKVFRLEAVRVGFKKAWQNKEYQNIVDIAEKIPATVIQEDEKLLMYYDNALTRLGLN